MKLRKEGIEGGLDFEVGGIAPRPKEGRHRTRLVLPREHEFATFIFDKRFHSFLDAIRRAPLRVHHHFVDSANAAVSIVFNPGSGGERSYSHPAYNLPHDVMHNVVYQALRDKSRQLKRAGPRDGGELAGVILCDGGCAMLRALAGIWTVPLDRVIQSFLRKSRTLDFVCVVDLYAAPSWPSRPLRFDARAWSLRYPDLIEDFQTQLNTALRAMPAPVRCAVNTFNHFKWAEGSLHRLCSDYKRDTWMKANSIEISLRGTMDYLAGRIDRAEYERVVAPDWLTHLRRRLDEGISVCDVSIMRHPGEDDDGLVLVFGDKDPAMSLFRRTQ